MYDANGNITAIYAVNGGQETLAHSYAYDGKNQLIREDAVGDGTYLYAYDGRGNLLSKSAYPFTPPETAVSGVPTVKTYTYSDLLADGSDGGWHDLLTGYDGQSIVYDGVGNPTEYLGWNMSWTQGRRLASMESANQTITYAYNQDGQRVEKSVCEKQSGVQTVYRYVLDGNRVVGMSVTAGAAPADFVWYDYDPSGSVIGFTVEKQDGTSSDFVYLKNLQGDVTEILNAAGQPVMTYTYNAWGLAAQTQAAGYDALSPTEKQLISSNPFRYRGYFYDSETGLYYVSSRYYDPETCRFVNADDPEIIDGGNDHILENNLFAYCFNDPMNKHDPSGYFAFALAGGEAIAGLWGFGGANFWNPIGWIILGTAAAVTVGYVGYNVYKFAKSKAPKGRPGIKGQGREGLEKRKEMIGKINRESVVPLHPKNTHLLEKDIQNIILNRGTICIYGQLKNGQNTMIVKMSEQE